METAVHVGLIHIVSVCGKDQKVYKCLGRII
jgi:hypothetical protein